MTEVTDQKDLELVAGKAHGFAVHLRDQRAGSVDCLQLAIGCRLHDGRRRAAASIAPLPTGGARGRPSVHNRRSRLAK
jgi:hypothetical protein